VTKYVFVTGGVVSAVGKGIAVAAIGRLMKSRGLRVSIQKFDPYINVDPGTMSPFQHGEVFVTDDGAETDLDLGHYERFTGENLSKASNVTSGQVYASVIAKERRGDYLGGTIQVIPHITNEIKERILIAARRTNANVAIVEVGGTVGDIESQSFLEAIRQMRKDVGRDNVLYIHVTLIPHLSASGELKTKPTQHSVNELRRNGIQPDVILCRSDHPLPDDVREKIALFSDVDLEAVVPMPTVSTIYEVPLLLERSGLGAYISNHLNLAHTPPDLAAWEQMVDRIHAPKSSVEIALVGKYIGLPDAYLSVVEAIKHGALRHDTEVRFRWVDAEHLADTNVSDALEGVHGVLVPGGFGYRGIEGKIAAITYARTRRVPFFGLCLGLQCAVIELGREVLGTETPNSTEFNPTTEHPVIDLLPEQRDIAAKGGTMRLGLWPCCLKPGSLAVGAYGKDVVFERHRHRFEVNNEYRDRLEAAGAVFSGLSPDGRLVEIMELREHPWFLGTQFHPEFRSRPDNPHPLFASFVAACKRQRDLLRGAALDGVQELATELATPLPD
jgi:CTP synthase